MGNLSNKNISRRNDGRIKKTICSCCRAKHEERSGEDTKGACKGACKGNCDGQVISKTGEETEGKTILKRETLDTIVELMKYQKENYWPKLPKEEKIEHDYWLLWVAGIPIVAALLTVALNMILFG